MLWCPESEFPGEQLAQYRRLEAPPGPQDPWRMWGDRTATKGQSPSTKACEMMGVNPEVAPLWFNGIG